MSKQNETRRPPAGGGRGGGPGGMTMTTERAKDFKGSLKKLISYMGRYKYAMVLVLILAAAASVFSIVGPKILAGATNEIADGFMAMIAGTGGIDFDAIAKIILTLAILYGISSIFAYTQAFVMTGITNKITYRLRRDVSEKLHRLPLKYFEGTSQGEVLSRITNDIDTVNQSLNQSVSQIISSAATLIGVLVMMLSISLVMTGVTLLVLPLSAIFSALIVRRSQKYFAAQQAVLGEVNGHIEESYGGQTVIKAFRHEEKCVSDFNKLNSQLYGSSLKAQFLSGLIMPAITFFGNLGYVAVCIVGAALTGGGSLTIGDIQAFIQYVRSFNQPIAQVANISNVLQQTAASAERVFELLAEPEEVAEAAQPVTVTEENGITFLCFTQDGQLKKQPFKGDVEFKNVSFGYSPDKIIIHDFSAKIAAGQKVALVGPTGAGKTTMVKLLMRFYDVNSGSIHVDGIDIRNFKRADLRSLLGMVLQDTWLYSDTIAENIRYGRHEATDEEVVEAAKAARVDFFVRTMPGGYNVEIDEESSNISAGQKQLLTIARAIIAKPKMLILDEATSSVDTKTEVDIQTAMNSMMDDRTSFIIAHRLSTIRGCDIILMMKNGDIVEQGSHNFLMEKNGAYADLYNSQFESA